MYTMKSGKITPSRTFWASVPPWLIIGCALILVPIFVVMTLQSIAKQRELTTRLLIEKGEAIIRSFEAGSRTGAGMQWGSFQLQKLLIETAEQPGVDYLILTDRKGVILADSDPSMIGESYGADLDLKNDPSKQTLWRRVPNPEGADTFEVYRPLASPHGEEWLIFVGLDMSPVLAAQRQDTRNIVLMAATLLLIGFAGIFSLFLAQGYRTARTSLSRVKAFSDGLVENLPIGLVAVDQRNRITAFNQTAETILGRDAKDVLGKSADEVLPDACKTVLRDLEAGGGVIEREMDCTVGGGSIPLEVIAATLYDDDGGYIGKVVLFRDMTELLRLKEEVERNRRLASVGSLAAGVAHEVRNPLSSIKGFATYLHGKYGDEEDKEVADIVIREVDRLNRVVGQLLELSRPAELKKERKEVGAVILHSLKVIEGQAKEKGIAVQVDLPPGVPAVMMDPDGIEQVLLNLYLNALEAMGPGGVLSVSLRKDSDGRIRVEVSDTGPGIGRDEISRIFDPYFTTKSSGTGLGLAIVHKVVEAHGGELQVESAPGKGTAVSILLPVD